MAAAQVYFPMDWLSDECMDGDGANVSVRTEVPARSCQLLPACHVHGEPVRQKGTCSTAFYSHSAVMPPTSSELVSIRIALRT